MDSGYTSDILVHFVGWRAPADNTENYRTLSLVLREGILGRLPHGGGWGDEELRIDSSRSLLDGQLVVPRMVCVADIPESALSIHCAKYGSFGLGFSRTFLVRYGFRPVMYFPYSSGDHLGAYGRTRLKWIEQAFRDCCEYGAGVVGGAVTTRTAGAPSSTRDEAMQAARTAFLRDLLPFLKPFNADLSSADAENYYLEREWRRLGNLCFRSSDVVRVYVPEEYVEQARSDHPAYVKQICSCPTAQERL